MDVQVFVFRFVCPSFVPAQSLLLSTFNAYNEAVYILGLNLNNGDTLCGETAIETQRNALEETGEIHLKSARAFYERLLNRKGGVNNNILSWMHYFS